MLGPAFKVIFISKAWQFEALDSVQWPHDQCNFAKRSAEKSESFATGHKGFGQQEKIAANVMPFY